MTKYGEVRVPVSELTSHAAGPGVPGISNRTSAAGGMQARLADGVGAAGFHVARVAARALHTLVRVGAVTVRLTARHCRHYRGRVFVSFTRRYIFLSLFKFAF
jgi:hypothetical protein